MNGTHHHYYGPSTAGSVVLNLGADIGALIIEAGPEQLGAEIEISRGVEAPRTHAMVRQRQTAPQTRYDALYVDLPEGDYTIWHDAHTPQATVAVVGGQITHHTWRP